jgi:hypothetical protein
MDNNSNGALRWGELPHYPETYPSGQAFLASTAHPLAEAVLVYTHGRGWLFATSSTRSEPFSSPDNVLYLTRNLAIAAAQAHFDSLAA